MRFVVINVQQRSEPWFAARAGLLTGSVASDMLATLKNGEPAASRRDLRTRLALERLTGAPQESCYVNADMQRGIDCEPAARAAYEAATGAIVTETGFVRLTDYMAGCSLDGHLDDFATLVSIKCPKSTTHLRYLREKSVPSDYVPQMLHECWVTGARRYEFVSFDDRFPDKLRLLRVVRDVTEDEVAAYEAKALAFLDEVDREYTELAALAA